MCRALGVTDSGFMAWCERQTQPPEIQKQELQKPEPQKQEPQKQEPQKQEPQKQEPQGAAATAAVDSKAGVSAPLDALQSWLALLCEMLPGVSCATVYRVEQGACLSHAAKWPAGVKPAAEQLDLANAALERSAPIIQGTIFAHPLVLEGQLQAVVVIDVAVQENQRAMVQSLLGWSEQWLRLILHSSTQSPGVSSDSEQSQTSAVEFALYADSLQAAVLSVCDGLARQFNCDQVVLGLLRGKRVRVKGFSHGLEFDARTRLITGMEEAMDELRSTPRIFVCPPASPESPTIPPALEQLWLAQEQAALCAVPLCGNSGVIGVLLCQRPPGRVFSAIELSELDVLGRMLGHVLELKQAPLLAGPRRVIQGFSRALDRLIKPGNRGFKSSVAALLVSVLFLLFAQGNYRVSADATVEGLVQRAVVAPFDAYVSEAPVRAGDTVAAGEVIARLDDRELALELNKSRSEEDRLNNEYRKALAGLERSEARILQSRLAQSRAQSQLLQQKLERIELSSPVGGLVVSGDLSRSLGAPVERGQVLFEVAPLQAYRLVLHIDERDIAELEVGQRGLLTLTSMPRERWSFVVDKVSPVFTERDDRVVYRTEARMEGDISRLLPGMEGLGKVEVGQRSFGWLLLHDMLDWLRLQLWLWLP